jgi:L-fuconolactonase
VSTPTGPEPASAGRADAGPASPTSARRDRAPALDAHVHVWDLAARPQPWTDGLPVLQRSFGLDDVAGDLRAAGQDGVIVVQTVASAAETRELLALAAAQPLVAGVVGWAGLSGPDPAGQLLAAQAAPGGRALVGVRHQLQEEPDQEWLARPQVRDGLRAVAAAGLAYDLVISPGQLPLVTETVTALPEVRFVLDHAGKPPIAAGNLGGGKVAAWTGGMAAWGADLRALAALPNVAVKLSGLVTEADWASWTPAQLGPVMEYVLAQFGPDRTMVGSDWPVCLLAASYAQVMAAVAPVLDGLTPAQRTAVRGGTARAWYRLDEHQPGA